MVLVFSKGAFAQKYNIDTLSLMLKSGQHKMLSFDDLLSIQRDNRHQDGKVVLACAEELLSRKEIGTSPHKKAQAYAEAGLNYSFAGEKERADSLLQISIEICKKINKKVDLSNAYNFWAIHNHNLDNDSLAVQMYTQAIKTAQEINDTVMMLKPYRGFTGLLFKMGLLDKGIEYAESGLKLARMIGDKKLISSLSNNTAIGYHKKKDYKKAMIYMKDALKMTTEIGLIEPIIRGLSNVGTAYLEINNVDSAKYYLYKAEKLLPQIDVPRTSVFTLSAMAELKNKEKKYNEAIKYAKDVIHIADQANLEGISDGAYDVLVKAYKALGQYDKALEANENYWKVKQKFLETNRNKSVSQIEQQFQQYKKTKEIEIQNAEIALLKKEQSISNLTRNGALILASLLSLLVYLYYTRFKLKQKTSDELSIKNTEIETQKEIIQSSLLEKETLLREIHHRVKNNLQIISSLLNIQSSTIEDEKVLASINDGQNRVQAMSLIHQNLYQSEHISNVAIESYLKQLTDYLAGVFGVSGDGVKIDIQAKDIMFDTDTAIPLGLIVNELVNNALKYAFKSNDKGGQINIEINPISESEYELRVSDNGKGVDDQNKIDNSNSMGLKLVKILSKQLRGTFTYKHDAGSVFSVIFKDLRKFNLNEG